MLQHTVVQEHSVPEDKAPFVWGTPLNEPDRDPEFNVLSPLGRRQSVKGLRNLRLPRPTFDSDRLHRARSNDALHYIVYNKGPPGQTPFPTIVAMSGYFPPNPYPQQGYYPPPPQHQNSYPPPSQPPQAPYYQAAGGYPGQAPPSSQQYSALGSAYAPAAYPPPTAMPSYPPTVEPSKPSASPENEQPPSYPPNPYAIPETDEKEGERGMFSGYSAPPMPVAYPSGGGMVATNANINYPYPSSQPRPVNSDEMFWILYHQRYNGNEKETKEAVMQEMARLNGQFGGGLPTDPSVQICPPGPVPGSQAYPAPAQPSMYPEYSQQQPYQPAYQHEEQQPPKKDGPDWMKLAGGVAAGGLAFAGTKKLFDLMKGDKKAHEHHH